MELKPKIYLAGKITKNGWRQSIVDLRSCYHGVDYYGFETPPAEWPVIDAGNFYYTGPYFIGCNHGCFHNKGTHGWGSDGYCNSASDFDDKPLTSTPNHGLSFVPKLCMAAIKNSDIVYAWIDGADCYGTIVEIGYACGVEKLIFIASPEYIPDLWFVYALATVVKFGQQNPAKFLNEVIEFYRRSTQEDLLESPIERKFWDALSENVEYNVIPQLHIGKYRVDFAIKELRIAIELDGHDYHKTKEQRSYDARRERYLQRNGWRVIRFTGSEVWRDVTKCVNELLAFIEICKTNTGVDE